MFGEHGCGTVIQGCYNNQSTAAMESQLRDTMVEAPWIALSPGVVIAMLVLGLNLLGDGLRDALDPRMKNTVR